MGKYRKKPVIIDAIRWDGTAECLEQIKTELGTRGLGNAIEGLDRKLRIDTLEGTMRANLGDMVIRGVKGELYPCKPDIFESTYEAT